MNDEAKDKGKAIDVLWTDGKEKSAPFSCDWEKVRKHCDKWVKSLFSQFDYRKSELLQAARHFYPLGVQGLVRGTETLGSWETDKETVIHYTPRPVEALRRGAAGFHSNLTSPSTKWFDLKIVGQDGSESGGNSHEVKRELDDLTALTADVMRNAFIYPAIQKVYVHCLCFGFACMLISEDEKNIVKATTLRVGTYALGINADGQVNRVARKFSWSAEEIVRKFGKENVPEKVMKAYGKPDAYFNVVNLIEPHDENDPLTKEFYLSPDMVYRSIYYIESCGSDSKTCGILEVRGFKICPIVAPRYDTELGDVYGYSPARLAVATARKVQSCEEDRMRIGSNNAEPPVIAAADFKAEGLRLGRGGINYTRSGDQRQNLVYPIFPQGVDSTGIREQETEGLQDIGDIFFNSVFATIDMLKNNKGVKSATEINALVRENLEALGAVVSNFDREFLDPLVQIVAFYTYHAFVGNAEKSVLDFVKVNYISKIHLAQRQIELSSIENHMAFASQIAQLQMAQKNGASVLDNINFDMVIRKHAMLMGMNADCVRSEEEVQNDRAMREAMAQEQQQIAQMAQAAQLAKDVGGIPTDENHAAGNIIKMAQGGAE